MKSNFLKRMGAFPPCCRIICANRSQRMVKSNGSLGCIWLLACLAVSLCCANQAVSLAPGDVPVTTPRLTSLNPCFSTKTTGIKLVDGTKQPVLELICGGIATWDIPQGVSSFHVTLWRAEAASAIASSQPPPNGLDCLRVLISFDGKSAVDTVLRDSTPAERWILPTGGAHTVSIEMEQEYGAYGLFLGDLGFSAQAVPAPSVRHVLSSGQGYANLGAGARQGAFFDFHPGEVVPIEAEFAGNAARADVQIRITLLTGTGANTIPVHIPLQTDGAQSVGSSQWQVPPYYGPAHVELDVAVAGQQVYSASYQVALSKEPDVSAASESSTFGIHESTNGSLLLQDDGASLWGVKWVRFFIDWDVVEANEGEYDWHWIDNVVQSYSAQHLALMGVMGHLPPKWITDPASQMMPSYAKFVNAALEHFKGKIHVWNVYNEIDAKFYTDRGFNRELQPTGDIQILRQELQQIIQSSPSLLKICCAAGGSDFLPYEKRLFDAGLITKIDGAELHPYQAGPPEESDLGLNYVQMAQGLARLTSQYGPAKRVWVTESNWLFGPEGTVGVMAPQVTEHEQSQYLVRCSLLSFALHVPYFIHSPFFFPWHRSVLIDSLASYSQLTSLLGAASNGSFLNLPPHLFGVTASTQAGTVVALWTDSQKPASIRISGLEHMTIQDMYGNPMPASENLQLSGSPVYLVGQGNPVVTAAAPHPPSPRMLDISTWRVSPGTRVQKMGNGDIQVTSLPTNYGSQLRSPVLDVIPNACYVIHLALILHKGGVTVAIFDPDANKSLRNEYVFTVTGNDQYEPEFRIKASEDAHLQVVITDANPHDAEVSDFEIGNVTMSDCP